MQTLLNVQTSLPLDIWIYISQYLEFKDYKKLLYSCNYFKIQLKRKRIRIDEYISIMRSFLSARANYLSFGRASAKLWNKQEIYFKDTFLLSMDSVSTQAQFQELIGIHLYLTLITCHRLWIGERYYQVSTT